MAGEDPRRDEDQAPAPLPAGPAGWLMPARPLIYLIRALAAAAALWAAGVAVRLMTRPAAMMLVVTPGGGPEPEPEAISWFEYAGGAGTLLLLLWTGVFFLGAWAAWTGRAVLLGLITIPVLALTWLALLSFGGPYLPAAVALLVALILTAYVRWRAPRV